MTTVNPNTKKVKDCERDGHGTLLHVGGGDMRLMCVRCGLVFDEGTATRLLDARKARKTQS
jgi:hypothetical protein